MTETSGPVEPITPFGTSSALLTFLIADVRGYTRFTVEQGDEAAARLASRFAELAEEIVGVHEGRVVELRGDEALGVFPSARNALRAAVALQASCKEVMAHDPSLPLQVGMGLDAGEAIPVKGGYRGGALNLAARLCSIAGGGEVFASEGVIHLARKTDGISFIDRGQVTLKGLAAPVRVIQIAPEGELPPQLPPLQPILVTHPTNLPDEPTRFIGREREIHAIAELLQQPHVRLLTLTGTGGTGKTRLSLQVGTTLLYDFRDGVFFVSLASFTDPALVPSAIAEVLGVKEEGGKDLLDSLTEHLKEKHLLLVLDNFEHLLDAASVVASLLDACRELHVLATSRIPLHLSREHEYLVPPLSVPDPTHLPTVETLSQFEAVALFIERAKAVRPRFQVTNENAPAVAEICYRLDGLPLAIELAAARVKLLPPQALLPRLSSRLQLLTEGARDRPTRQQTLRGAIDWSYSLLTPEEQTLFARLSVFAAGCSLEAAEAVCNPQGDLDLLEGMASLVDKSLLRQEGEEEPRFLMLETIREYAAERLAEQGEANQIRDAHATHYLELAEEAEPELRGRGQREWFGRLEAEHDNLRAALGWLLEQGRAEEELRLAVALSHFWHTRGYWSEGLRWLEAGLALGAGAAGVVRARALGRVGLILGIKGELDRAIQLLEESLSIFRQLGDNAGRARTVLTLGGAVYVQGDVARATQSYEESLAFFRQVGDRQGIMDALGELGNIPAEGGDFAVAEARFREALALAREIGDRGNVAISLNNLGFTLMEQGKYEEASAALEESLTLARELRMKTFLPAFLDSLACVASEQGDHERAEELFAEGLSLSHELGIKWVLLYILGHLAELSAVQGKAVRAARLAGAEAAGREAARMLLVPARQEGRERALSRAQQELGEDAFRRAWERGRAMSLEEAVAYALDETDQSRYHPGDQKPDAQGSQHHRQDPADPQADSFAGPAHTDTRE